MSNPKFHQHYQTIKTHVRCAAYRIRKKYQNQFPAVDVDDLVQEGMMYAWRKMPSYDETQAQVSSYLAGAAGKMEDYIAGTIRASGLEMIESYDRPYTPPTDECITWNEIKTVLTPEEERLLNMRFVEDLTVEEIAKKVQQPRTTIGVQIKGIRKKLRSSYWELLYT